jgi:hypothetical protein
MLNKRQKAVANPRKKKKKKKTLNKGGTLFCSQGSKVGISSPIFSRKRKQ